MGSNFPLQFNTIPYPLWRRKLPFGLSNLIQPLAERYLAATADLNPPTTALAMANYMARWGVATQHHYQHRHKCFEQRFYFP